jgi:uncharacterized membrane protein
MRDHGFEGTLGRLMIAMTSVAVALLIVGVALMMVNGISPLAGGPVFDPALLWQELRAGTPAGFLWLGLIVVIATPVVRVAAASVGFARAGEWQMVGISIGILLVIAVAIASSLVTEF